MNIEIFGFLGGALVTVSLLPQVIKSFKLKSTKDISIGYTLILITGLILWIPYAVIHNIIPLIIFTSIELAFAISLLTLKLIYKQE